jgi:hypothetical protein
LGDGPLFRRHTIGASFGSVALIKCGRERL